jgi:hypothetical protein
LILVNNGRDDTDRAISDLFAEPHAELAPDPQFVARVMGQIARRRRLRTAALAAVAALLLVAIRFAIPTITASTDVVASLPVLLTVPFQELLSSPIGFALSLPLGILVLTLSTLRLHRFGE